MSKSVKYMTALLVVIISFFGFSSALSYFNCSQAIGKTESYRNSCHGQWGNGECHADSLSSYQTTQGQACTALSVMNIPLSEAGTMTKNTFAGTLFLDGVIAILYYLFSKSKKKAAEEKSATSSHEKQHEEEKKSV